MMNIGCDIDRDTGGVAPSKARLRQRQKCEANAATIQNAFLDLLARRHTRTQTVFFISRYQQRACILSWLNIDYVLRPMNAVSDKQHFRYTYVGEENACM
jgi:hypothetical protein